MFKFILKHHQNHSEDSSNHQQNGHNSNQHLLPVSTYIKIFFILLVMIFINIGFSMLPISSGLLICLLLFVAITQTVLVAFFFMELIHEDKAYTFIFLSTILFILLFFCITLLELKGRDFFTPLEGIKMMRAVDKNGDFAPGGPKLDHAEKEKK